MVHLEKSDLKRVCCKVSINQAIQQFSTRFRFYPFEFILSQNTILQLLKSARKQTVESISEYVHTLNTIAGRLNHEKKFRAFNTERLTT